VAELRLALQQPDGRHRALLTRARVARWLRAALGDAAAEITVRVVGEDEGRAINRDYRAKDYATNVLTFDYQRARDAKRMQARETTLLAVLGHPDPYAEDQRSRVPR
jgi:ssRNA-specific RNase YbeY (16S rRNA maturation enzyme)